MTLDGPEDEVVGMLAMMPDTENNVMVVSENGYGKRSLLEDYRITNRGGKGVRTLNITDKTGRLVAIKSVNDDNDLVIINISGITLRIRLADLRVQGRYTIASVCCVDTDPEEETEELDGAELPSVEEGNLQEEEQEDIPEDEITDEE